MRISFASSSGWVVFVVSEGFAEGDEDGEEDGGEPVEWCHGCCLWSRPRSLWITWRVSVCGLGVVDGEMSRMSSMSPGVGGGVVVFLREGGFSNPPLGDMRDMRDISGSFSTLLGVLGGCATFGDIWWVGCATFGDICLSGCATFGDI